MKKIVVAGGGVLGSQIAFQCAFHGNDVTLWLHNEKALNVSKEKIAKLKDTYLNAINDMANGTFWSRGIALVDNFNKEDAIKKAEEAFNNIKYEMDLNVALKDCDLLIECIKEDLKVKCDFFESIKDIISDNAIIATNSSTLLPSLMAKSVKNNERFLAMHFANSIWKNNIIEVMGHKNTKKEVFDECQEFAKSISMIPLPIMKEKSGYLLNSLLVPFLLSAFDLYANGVSDPESIDKAWTLGTGSPNGPFVIMDVVGLETVKNIVTQYQKVPKLINPLLSKMMMPYNFKGMLDILNKYIAEGKMGKSSGEGFYKYNK